MWALKEIGKRTEQPNPRGGRLGVLVSAEPGL